MSSEQRGLTLSMSVHELDVLQRLARSKVEVVETLQNAIANGDHDGFVYWAGELHAVNANIGKATTLPLARALGIEYSN